MKFRISLALVVWTSHVTKGAMVPSFIRTDYDIGGHPSAVAVGDFDNDGSIDIVTANPTVNTSIALMLNYGNGTFLPATVFGASKASSDIKVVDLDNDGNLDIVAIGGSPHAHIFYGNGDGTFQEPTDAITNSNQESVRISDVNSDGLLDIIVVGGNVREMSVNIQNLDGTFGPRLAFPMPKMPGFTAAASPWELAVGDLNGDGHLDVVIGSDSWDPELGRRADTLIFIGDGMGSFAYDSSYPGPRGRAVEIADINGDGFLDLICTIGGESSYNWGNNLQVFLGNVSGLDMPTVFSVNPDRYMISDIVVTDVDGDGFLDVVTANPNPIDGSYIAVLFGDGTGAFGSPMRYTTQSSNAVAAADLNGDSVIDIVTVGGGLPGKVTVLASTLTEQPSSFPTSLPSSSPTTSSPTRNPTSMPGLTPSLSPLQTPVPVISGTSSPATALTTPPTMLRPVASVEPTQPPTSKPTPSPPTPSSTALTLTPLSLAFGVAPLVLAVLLAS